MEWGTGGGGNVLGCGVSVEWNTLCEVVPAYHTVSVNSNFTRTVQGVSSVCVPFVHIMDSWSSGSTQPNGHSLQHSQQVSGRSE